MLNRLPEVQARKEGLEKEWSKGVTLHTLSIKTNCL